MLARIAAHQYTEIKERHREVVAQYPLINAVVSRVQAGFVYADEARAAFFIATKAGFSLFHGPATAAFDQEFFTFLRANLDIPNYIHIYNPNGSFRRYVEANWDKYKIRRRAQFRYHQRDLSYNYLQLLPPQYQIANVQEVGFAQLEEAFKLDLARRYWDSKADFLAHAVGACILNEQRAPVAICYSACVVDGVAEMDTLVLGEYRGRRFMRIVSEPFFNLAIEQKLTPHWDTFTENAPSYVMAQKFGLQLRQEYDLMSLLLR